MIALLHYREGQTYRPADPWLTVSQAAQATTTSLGGYVTGVRDGTWPAPYYAAPDRPLFKASELALAAAERGRVPPALLRVLPVGPDGKPVLPERVVALMEQQAAERERFAAMTLPSALRPPGRS